MLRTIIAALLISVPALAQQQPIAVLVEQKIQKQLGELLFTVNVLTVQVEWLTEENRQLKEKLAEKP